MRTISFLLLFSTILLDICNAKTGSLRNLQSSVDVVRFELINGITNTKIRDLYNKAVIDLSTISGMTVPSFNVRAVLSSGAAVVVFDYQSTRNFNSDSSAPYTLCPAASCSVLNYGNHTIRAAAYKSISSAASGKSLSITFEIRRAAVTTVQPILGLQLMDVSVVPNKVATDLKFGARNVIDLQKLGLSDAQFNIQALVGSMVQSVKFNNGWTETSKPLAYCGNVGDIFTRCNDLIVGTSMNITVTGYSLAAGLGTPFPLQWAFIEIIPGAATPTKAPSSIVPPVSAPVPAPVQAPVVVPVQAPISVPAPIDPPIGAAPVVPRACTIPQVSDL
jgi:hypothetical protein